MYKRTTSKPEESFDLGYVLWDDAQGQSGGATHEPPHAPIPLMTAGIIVKSDDSGVTLAMDFSAEGSFRDTRFIPRVNIRPGGVKILQKGAIRRSPQWAMFPSPAKPRKKGKK